MIEIVKVQRPIATTDPDSHWLIYDKAQKHVHRLANSVVPSRLRKQMGRDMKAFFEGEWTALPGWQLGRRVKNQDW